LLAVALCQLVDEQALRFDDPVCRYLPDFRAAGKGDVTVEDVLSHAGGFRVVPSLGPYRERFDAFVRRISASTLEAGWRPGKDQGYHQETAWYVLAALVEASRGRPYGDVVVEHVCAPLGLDSTWATMTAAVHSSVWHRLAVPSYVANGAVRRQPYLISQAGCQTKNPSYGYYGPMADLARFYEAALAGLRKAGAFPVSPKTLASMTGPVRGPAWDRTWSYECEYGRGFFRDLRHHWAFGRRWSGSSFGLGGLIGHVCAGADPETGVVVAASFGALTVDRDDIEALMDDLYAAALS
jgi:CubicO group peptidase (beta-lactamase class C family)